MLIYLCLLHYVFIMIKLLFSITFLLLTRRVLQPILESLCAYDDHSKRHI